MPSDRPVGPADSSAPRAPSAFPTAPTEVPDTPLYAATAALLGVRMWTAHDLDDAGRVLAGHDEHGSSQLVEVAPDGTRTQLTALSRPCSGRYVPGRRQVIVQHDAGGNELMQLSLLDLRTARLPVTEADLVPLVHDPAFMHVLQDVTPTAVVYSTNRRNGVDMDVVVRDLTPDAIGVDAGVDVDADVDAAAERVAYAGGGWVATVCMSHDLTRVAMTSLSLRPNGTVVTVASPDGATVVTDPDEDSAHEQAHWAADDTALVFSSNRDRDMQAVVRVPLDGRPWATLVADDAHDLSVDPSPDGSTLLVGTLHEGGYTFAIHEADGSLRAGVDAPAYGSPSVRWSPDGPRVRRAGSGPTDPGSIHVIDARTGLGTRV
ncbi:MAG: hypothetical protein WAR57_01375, partial [Candidatus Phosphoribacter sp.]